MMNANINAIWLPWRHLRYYQTAEHRACKMGGFTNTNAWVVSRTTATWWFYSTLAWNMYVLYWPWYGPPVWAAIGVCVRAYACTCMYQWHVPYFSDATFPPVLVSAICWAQLYQCSLLYCRDLIVLKISVSETLYIYMYICTCTHTHTGPITKSTMLGRMYRFIGYRSCTPKF